MNKEVMEKMLICLKDLAEKMGPASLEQNIDEVIASLELFLDKQTFCQRRFNKVKVDEYDDEEENSEGGDSEDLDHDELILGNTTDVIIAISAAFGDSFLPYL